MASGHLKRVRGSPLQNADTCREEKKIGEREEAEDQYLGAEAHALDGGELDPDDLLEFSPSELIEHTGEQGWD